MAGREAPWTEVGVGTAVARPGPIARGGIPVGNTMDGERTQIPVTVVCGCDLPITVHSGGDHSYPCPTLFAPETPACLEPAAAMGPDRPLITKAFLGSDLTAPLVNHAREGSL